MSGTVIADSFQVALLGPLSDYREATEPAGEMLKGKLPPHSYAVFVPEYVQKTMSAAAD